MRVFHILFLPMILLAVVPVRPVFGQQPQGTNLLTGTPESCFTRIDGAPRITLQNVNVEGPGFTRAWRLTTAAVAGNAWDGRLRCFSTVGVKKGDKAVATYYIRSTREEEGLATFVWEQNVSPFEKSVTATATAGRAWKKVQVPIVSVADYAAGGYNLSFWVNSRVQEIEIGGFSISNFGPDADFRTMDLVGYPYEGAESDAAWRKEALERIERLRRGDIAVVVRDAEGRPVANAPVQVKMKRHAFGWGTAVDGGWLGRTGTDADRYREAVRANFNRLVLENDLKWPFWETWARNSAEVGLTWARNNGFTEVRGHTIIWPGKRNLPADVVQMLERNPVDKDALRARIEKHIDAVTTYTRGRVTEWDVQNEPFDNKDVQAVLGDEEPVAWFRRARQNDPAVKLYLNDYSNVENSGANTAHINESYRVLKLLKDKGAPVDGFGLQSHFGSALSSPEKMLAIMDRFAALGVELQVTEFDINIKDEAAQAQFTRDYMILCYSHPAMTGFLMWGFWAGKHWLPDGAMFRQDWSPKPNYDVWRELLFKTWWTDEAGTTDSNGVFRTRGYAGEYDVTVNAAGTTRTFPLTVVGGQTNTVANAPVQPGAIASGGVVHAASFAGGPVAPGQIVTIFGTGFGPASLATASYAAGRLPTAVGDTRVLFDGVAAPMVYAAAGQVSAIVPYRVSGTANVQVEYLGAKTAAVAVPVAEAAPAFFACAGKPELPVLVNNSANRAISCAEGFAPIAPGAVLTAFLTGEGKVDRAIGDGQLPGAPFPAPEGGLQLRLNGRVIPACGASFAGLVYAGVTQVNFCLPADAPSGARVTLEVGAKGQWSKPVSIPVQ